jgi:tetratricopeptide (TPR) repeat protein
MTTSSNRNRVDSLRRWGLWPLLLAGLALTLSLGWWLGLRQRAVQAPEDPRRAVLQREVISLRQRLDRQQASDGDRQRLLELLVALDRQGEAISLLEPMADQEPDRWSLRLMLAELRRDQNDRAGAERELRMILSRQSDQVEALQLMTLLELEQGAGAAAEARVTAAFNTAINPEVKPEAMGVGLLLAELQQKRGQRGAAEATYRRLAQAFPQDQRPLLGLALLRHGAGDIRGAQEALAEARQRGPQAGKADPRLDRLAASWGLAPLRAPGASARPVPAPAPAGRQTP